MKKIISILTMTLISTIAWADLKPYGFVKAAIMHSNTSLTSDHKAFQAANNNDQGVAKESRTQFSVKQSRFGWAVAPGKDLDGKFEFDLDGEAGNTSGAVSSNLGIIRVRQANIEYSIADGMKISVGKKWSKFAGVLPHTHLYTTVNLKSGSTGFLVDGLDYTQALGPVSFAFEIHNNTTDDAEVNKISMPVVGAMVEMPVGGHKVGLAATFGTLEYEKVNSSYKNSLANGFKVYYIGKVTSSVELRAETFVGSNLASIAAGGLAKAKADDDKSRSESGGFISARYESNSHGVYGGFGVARLLKLEDAGPEALSANSQLRIGYDHKVSDNGLVFAEYQSFRSTYNEVTPTNNDSFSGGLLEAGLVIKF